MIHDKIFKRENGDKVKITVDFYIDRHDKPTYNIHIFLCENGKRKFNQLSFDDWNFRNLSMDERSNYRRNEILKHVSNEEVLDTISELWNRFSPNNAVLYF